MAYTRKGEHGSAIYLWSDSDWWYCTDCDLPEVHTNIRGETFSDADLKDAGQDWGGSREVRIKRGEYGELGKHLLHHVAAGQLVPEQVFERLRHEMEGLPYETDTMKGIREAAVLAEARRMHAAGGTHDCGEWFADGVCQLCGVRETPLAPVCGTCGFSAESAEEAVTHMVATGHGLSPAMLQDLQDSAGFAELRDALTYIMTHPEAGTPVDLDDEDIPEDEREALREMLQRIEDREKDD